MRGRRHWQVSNCFDCSQFCAIKYHDSLDFSTLLWQTADREIQIIDDIVHRLEQDGGQLKNDLDGWTTWDTVLAMMKEYKTFLALDNQCTDKSDPDSVASLDFHMEMNLNKRGITCVLYRLIKYHLGLFLDKLFGVKHKCGVYILDEMRCCV